MFAKDFCFCMIAQKTFELPFWIPYILVNQFGLIEIKILINGCHAVGQNIFAKIGNEAFFSTYMPQFWIFKIFPDF